ncbi:hypothetical protein B9Z55_015455 [Caenorhabditis nigoni]|uniref:Uncharacterized protein n=1 Tax=Caenorhabditis nigoni TaxID=1611254 RepID=A0A2G5UAW2_9PELO|nr:hypothetical protein B9Z55_015455 [Caenorhabditis nigoni]
MSTKFSNFQITSWFTQRRNKDRENKRLSGSSRRSETPESPDDVIDVPENQNMEEIVDSILASSVGPFVNGFNLSYLAEKMMERRDNKFTSRTSSFGTPESSTNVNDLSRRTSFSGENFSVELEESRCQKTGEILEDSETTPPCYIDGNVKTSCDECFKKTKLFKLLEDSEDVF